MVKIFPTRFFVENANTTADQVWKWINGQVKDSKVSHIVPLQMEYSTSKTSHIIKGLIEVHCTENITTSELEKILKPHPSFIQQIYFTFQ
jgi:hypothetical protein